MRLPVFMGKTPCPRMVAIWVRKVAHENAFGALRVLHATGSAYRPGPIKKNAREGSLRATL
jgi:hypothetical protein